ncbi:hypothetical protein K9L27_03090 [Candidatus Gracilibacteria bacterium]|nr:hypothetical protein [Candidatus Gracilibacteria bacterium]
MKTKRVLLSAIVLSIFSFLYAGLTCGHFFKWVYEIEPIIWIPEAEMMANMPAMFGITFLMALFFSLVYAILYKGIPGTGVRKGINYAFFMWLVGPFLGMAGMPLYMTISWTVVIYWVVSFLVSMLIQGALLGAIYKEK